MRRVERDALRVARWFKFRSGSRLAAPGPGHSGRIVAPGNVCRGGPAQPRPWPHTITGLIESFLDKQIAFWHLPPRRRAGRDDVGGRWPDGRPLPRPCSRPEADRKWAGSRPEARRRGDWERRLAVTSVRNAVPRARMSMRSLLGSPPPARPPTRRGSSRSSLAERSGRSRSDAELAGRMYHCPPTPGRRFQKGVNNGPTHLARAPRLGRAWPGQRPRPWIDLAVSPNIRGEQS